MAASRREVAAAFRGAVAMSTALDRFFRSEWAGGWTLARLIFVFALAHGHLPRILGVGDAFGAPDMVLNNSLSSLNEYVFVTPELAYALWGIGTLGLVLMLLGGRWFRAGLGLWLIGGWLLMLSEGLNIKAHDRLGLLMVLPFLFSPLDETELTKKYRSPIGRYFMLLIFGVIYFETGLMKLMYESSWMGSGEVLAYHLVHPFHGNTALGAWLSGQPLLMAPMAWFTLAFELWFPLLVLFRKTNPWILAAGALFHLTLLVLMDVGAFGYMSLASYPVLLHPEVGRRVWERIHPFLRR